MINPPGDTVVVEAVVVLCAVVVGFTHTSGVMADISTVSSPSAGESVIVTDFTSLSSPTIIVYPPSSGCIL